MAQQPTNHSSPRRIAIIGAGFSGTALAAELHRLADRPLDIFLIDKTGFFGTGAAYSTPYAYHLLNVRSKDMSVFEEDPTHFVNWLTASGYAETYLEKNLPISEQFAPRVLYGTYLKDLLNAIMADSTCKVSLKLVHAEVIDIDLEKDAEGNCHAKLLLNDSREMMVDKVVLALGNGAPADFPFPVSADIHCINNPWDYTALNKINKEDPVLIVGTGLSMIDAVLTLHDQHHQGMIYAVSRHGLLPLPHTDTDKPSAIDHEKLPQTLRQLSTHLRSTIEAHVNKGGDWRSVINALRSQLPSMWIGSSLSDKKRFLRHLMPYWNIHRHRVHHQLNNLLINLAKKGQLQVISGRVMSVSNGSAFIRKRHETTLTEIKTKWLINCMGPGLNIATAHRPLAELLVKRGQATLDPLKLGFDVTPSCILQDKSGAPSPIFYSLGPPTKGIFWESTAVPEIRKQSLMLARTILENVI